MRNKSLVVNQKLALFHLRNLTSYSKRWLVVTFCARSLCLCDKNLALGFDFVKDLVGFQILVRYNVRAHSGSCSIRNFRSVPFSGHCGECRRPLRHTEARPNDHLFLEIIFNFFLFFLQCKPKRNDHCIKKSSHSTKGSLSYALIYLLI